jgi:hypothetical protein
MKVIGMRHRIFMVGVGSIIIACFVGGFFILGSDKKTEDKNNTSTRADGSPVLAQGSSAPIAKEQVGMPSKRSPRVSLVKCSDVSKEIIRTVLGSSFAVREAPADSALSFDVKVCEFTASSKILMVIVHDFGGQQIASTNQETLKKRGYSSDRLGTVVIAAKVMSGSKQNTDEAQRVVAKLRSTL